MFRDAIKTTGNEGKITVKDLSELVSEALEMEAKPEMKAELERRTT